MRWERSPAVRGVNAPSSEGGGADGTVAALSRVAAAAAAGDLDAVDASESRGIEGGPAAADVQELLAAGGGDCIISTCDASTLSLGGG